MAGNIKISRATENYWNVVKSVIDAAGSYAWAIKLRDNLNDPDTAWKVMDIYINEFDGKMPRLENAIEARKKLYYAKVAKLNVLCRQHGMMQVTKPEKLLNLLLNPAKRQSYKDKMVRRKKKDIICSLQEFEMKKKK